MITLHRTLSVQTFDVQATVAVGAKRPELLAVARLAADWGEPLTGADIAQELLGGKPAHVGQLVLDRCAALGLLEWHGEGFRAATLSALGNAALLRREVFVPQEDTWRFYFATDPLLDTALLHLEQLDASDSKAERQELRQARLEGRRPTDGEDTPSELRQARETTMVAESIAGGCAFNIQELSNRGCSGPSAELRLVLSWEAAGEPAVSIRGRLETPSGVELPVDYRLPHPEAIKETSYEQVWMLLAAFGCRVNYGLVENWYERTKSLAVPIEFDDLKDKARRDFQQDIDVPISSLRSLGTFDSTELKSISVVPATDDDAQRWAIWLQWDSIDHYLVPDGLRHLAEQVSARFPHYRPTLLSPDDLLRRALRSPRDARSRFLAAPHDLGLWTWP